MFVNEDARCVGLLKNAPLQQQMMACSAVHVARRRARLVVTYDEWRHELQNAVKFTGIKVDLGLFDSHVTQMESNGFLREPLHNRESRATPRQRRRGDRFECQR